MKTATATLLAAASMLIAGCSGGAGPGTQPTSGTASLSITPGDDTLFVGDTVRFTAPKDSGPLSWTVSDTRVAAIEEQGASWVVVRALHQGATTVSAARGGSSASAVLVVDGEKLAFTSQPSTATAGVVFTPITVAIEDPSGHPVASATNAVTVALGANQGGATLLGTTTVTAVNGIATFQDLSIEKAGTGYTLVAFSDSVMRATSVPFAIDRAAPAQLAFAVQPGATEYTQPITPAIQVAIQDAFGNPEPNATSVITIAIGTNPNGGTLSGTIAATAVNGVATFPNLRLDRPASGYALAATATGLATGTSDTFDVEITFAAVSDGTGHTCALTPPGAAYCWGFNNQGELGNGTTTGSPVCGTPCVVNPAPVSGGLTFASVSAGASHSCGVTLAGAAYCWGDNSSGDLGDGTTAQRTSPVAVSGGLTFAMVSAAGNDYTCGVTTAGAAYCWGDNGAGQLGNGGTTNSTTPVAVTGGLTFSMVSAGYSHTCGVTTAGSAYCWGFNGVGKLGNGDTTSSTMPVAVSGGFSFAAVSAGGDFTCGVTTGAAYCWGANALGQLGNGSTTTSTTPVAVAGGLDFRQVSAGEGSHTCGVTTAGAAYCWGTNYYGALGHGPTASSTIPLEVFGALVFTTISAGYAHTCGVTSGGATYCWGANWGGQLGIGSVTPSFFAGCGGNPCVPWPSRVT